MGIKVGLSEVRGGIASIFSDRAAGGGGVNETSFSYKLRGALPCRD